MKVRFEHFGGIVSLEKPALLAFVSRNFLLKLGYAPHPAWSGTRRHLSAPTEAHLMITNRCNMACASCYTGATPAGDPGELSGAGWRMVLKTLADMGVFHVALGGGESLLRSDLFDLAAYARMQGMVPNLTTNGHELTSELARRCRIFGQVNVSLDGTSDEYAINRRGGSFSSALNGLKLLKKAGVRCGINMVVSRRSFDQMENVVRLAKKLKLHDVEFLRYKPGGRAAALYGQFRLSDEQTRTLYPKLLELTERYRVPLKADCSFVPFIACHRPAREVMEFYGVLGCEGGNHLLGVRSDGALSVCSFVEEKACEAAEVAEQWDTNRQFNAYRNWCENAPEPCASCEYLHICRGGCHAVTQHYYGDISQPDPECPFVVDYLKKPRNK